MKVPKRVVVRDRKYLDYVATLPCLVCGRTDTVVPAHTGHSSMGMKDGDDMVIALCYLHHEALDGRYIKNSEGGKEKWLVKNVLRPSLAKAYQTWRREHG